LLLSGPPASRFPPPRHVGPGDRMPRAVHLNDYRLTRGSRCTVWTRLELRCIVSQELRLFPTNDFLGQVWERCQVGEGLHGLRVEPALCEQIPIVRHMLCGMNEKAAKSQKLKLIQLLAGFPLTLPQQTEGFEAVRLTRQVNKRKSEMPVEKSGDHVPEENSKCPSESREMRGGETVVPLFASGAMYTLENLKIQLS
jgi:hypothetical protein